MRALICPLLLAASAAASASDEVPFEPSAESFADAAACKARLASIVTGARKGVHAPAEGPYEIGPGDVRSHWVVASGNGHRITEHRCLGKQLSSRSWTHSMDGSGPEEPETIESIAAKAEWLKKDKPR